MASLRLTREEHPLVHQISPARQRSWNVRFAGIGASRPDVHRERPGARSANRPRPRPVLATFIEALNDFGCDHAAAHALHAARSERVAFADRRRRSASNRSCSGMLTGQASMHAPHSVDALESSAASSCWLASSGVSTAPTGPLYTHP